MANKLDITLPPCCFCEKPTMDVVIQTKEGDKNICGQCFFDALEFSHKLKGEKK